MGIIRLAQGLKQLESIDIYTSRSDDIANKICGNRVYLDFISIVYKMQENVLRELNYLLYSFLLINDGTLAKSELDTKFIGILRKYCESIEVLEEIIHIVVSGNDHADKITALEDIITSEFIETFKINIKKNDTLSEFIYNEIIYFVVDMLNNKLVDVEYVMIAFDGIPSFAKIQEQRQRRYMRYCLLEFQQQLAYVPSSHALRRTYDDDHFLGSIRGSIEYVTNAYETGRLKKDIKSKTSKMTEIDVVNEKYGEGEKILMDKLIADSTNPNIEKNKSYVFYSPDGDSVMLCLYIYIKTKISKLQVIKTYLLDPSDDHNNQCQYVPIPKLYENIVNIIRKYSKLDLKTEPEQDSCCRDFIANMNMFGNDFLHCIPTLDIGTTMMDMLYIYSIFIAENDFITFVKEGVVRINYEIFKKWMHHCAKYEEWISLDSYLANTKMKKKLTREFGEIFTHRYVIDYKDNVNLFKRKLRNLAKKLNKKDMLKLVSDGVNNLNKIITITGKKYGDIMKSLEMHNNLNKYVSSAMTNSLIDPYDLYNIRPTEKNIDLYDLIDTAEAPYVATNEPIYLNDMNMADIQPRQFADFMFMYKNIRATYVPHNQMPTAKHDIDFYLLEWRSGKWKNILNAQPYDFTYNYKKKAAIPIEQEMHRYQNEFLHISNEEMNKMVISYLKGYSWIVDYYMNTYDADKISTWSYNYERSPFFQHIDRYLSKITTDQLRSVMKDVYKDSLVDTNQYIDKPIHRFYIYPAEENTRKHINSKYVRSFPDLAKYVKETVNNNKKKYFDCRLCPYFSKCIFKSKNLTFDNLKEIQAAMDKKNKEIS